MSQITRFDRGHFGPAGPHTGWPSETRLQELIRELASDAVEFRQLARELSRYPRLERHVLQRANASEFGCERRIDNLLHALVLLGSNMVARELESLRAQLASGSTMTALEQADFSGPV